MGQLTTHILDTMRGRPGAGIAIELYRLARDRSPERLAAMLANADGRTDAPLLSGENFLIGDYELVFHLGDYFRAAGAYAGAAPFLDRVPLQFTISEPNGRYHVPLLCSPWGYSTYRGS